MKFKSIKAKIAVFAGLCLIGAMSVQVVAGLLSTRSNNAMVVEKTSDILDRKTRESVSYLASTQAGLLRGEFDSALVAARTMAHSFAMIADGQGHAGTLPEHRRQLINDILLNVLKQNPGFNGTYTAWEPNALDGQDDSYRNRRETGTDATGRFIPYWNRDAQGKVAMQPLVEYDSHDLHPNGVMKGGWYIGPQTTGRESVLDPLPYVVQGQHVYLATLSVPIMADGKFRGVAGADFNLQFVQKLARDLSLRLFGGNNEVVILSNMGLVVADSSHPEEIGSSFAKRSPTWNQDLALIQKGDSTAEWQGDTLRSFAPIPLGQTGKPWSVLITVPRSVVMAEAADLQGSLSERTQSAVTWSVGTSLLVALLAIAVMWLAASTVTRPIVAMTAAMKRLAEGDKGIQVPARDQADEIGQMAQTVEVFKTNAIRMEEMQRKQEQTAAQAAEERKRVMHDMARKFEDSVMGVVQELSTAADEMQTTAQSMSSLAQQSSDQAATAATAAGQATVNVQTVASAAEQLSSSIDEISRQIAEAANISQAASEETARTNEMVQELANASSRISEVVKMINDISSQTNLLALNATIEAARAGDAGKGFAVVAHEVKNLANQAARATDEISGQISAIQDETRRAVEAIGKIGVVIEQVRQISTTIASAIEQQGAATQEIARNVQQAAQGTNEVSNTIMGLSQSAGSTGEASEKVLASAGGMNRHSERLRGEVTNFLASVRAD